MALEPTIDHLSYGYVHILDLNRLIFVSFLLSAFKLLNGDRPNLDRLQILKKTDARLKLVVPH